MTGESRLMVLRLEGMLQSWGEDAKWDYRGTAGMPTKSGVVGLLACAMGFPRESPEIQQLAEHLAVAVRADRPGVRMTDFQTVTGKPLMTAEGKTRSSGNTFISGRVYLQDASFTVALETDAVWHKKILNGLRHPRWCMYLGRKNCVPSRPVLEHPEPDCHDLMELIQRYPTCERPQYPMSYECEIPNDGLASYERTDERLAGYRKFTTRRVWRGSIEEVQHVPDQD